MTDFSLFHHFISLKAHLRVKNIFDVGVDRMVNKTAILIIELVPKGLGTGFKDRIFTLL